VDESRFSFGSWLFLAIALLVVAVSAGQLIYRIAQPTDGWLADNSEGLEALYNLLGQPSTLREGDAVLSIGGRLPNMGLQRSFEFRSNLPAGWAAGGSAPYEIRRDGKLMTVQVPLYNWRLAALVPQLLDLFVVSTFFLMALALLVFFRRPGNWGARALLLVGSSVFALGLSSSISQLYDGLLPTAVLTLFFSFLSWGTLLWPSFFLLSISFPRPKSLLAQRPWLTLAVIYSVAPIVLAVTGRLENGFYLVAVWSLLAIAMVAHSAWRVRDAVGRAQLRWAGAGMAVGAATMIAVIFVSFSTLSEQLHMSNAAQRFWESVPTAVVVLAPALGFAIAILRYRLFDIDVIIRRTLVYSVLTGMLALVYLVSVLVLQAVFGALLGDSQNSLVAVLSTLAIAALFVPLRGRVQALIDRRFFRRKYDAARTLSIFSARLRDEVDLDRLSDHLATVASETMEPTHISLWLKPQADQADRLR
jgi:hypothetical protein